MSKDSGFIKIHRSIVDWEWYTDTKTLALFIHLLLTVEYKEKKYKGHKIPKGSRVCSYASLAEESGLSVQSVRTAINHLKSTGEVTISKTPHFSIISIENWGKYQDRQQGGQQGANKALTGHQQHPKNIRNKEYSLDTHKRVSKESEKQEKAVGQYADWNDKW